MNILIITFDPPQNIGGIEGRANNYTEQLVKLGHNVEVISFSPEGRYEEEMLHGAKHVRFPSSSGKAIQMVRRTAREISKNSVDAIFILSGAITLYGILLLLYAKGKGIHTLVFYYGKDILTARRSRVSSFLLWLSPKFASDLAVNSHYTASLLPEKYAKKAKILYPCIDPRVLSEIKEMDLSTRKERIILFVGRLVMRKGADDLLKAFSQVLAVVPYARMEIVGDGPEFQALQDLSKYLNLETKVEFWGRLSGPQLYERYADCDIFAMPSKKTKTDVEGFGTVFLEAGLFGKPSIGTFSGGIPEAVEDGVTGLLVPEGNVGLLASAIDGLLINRTQAEAMGRNARTRVLSHFTWQKGTEMLVSVLAERGM